MKRILEGSLLLPDGQKTYGEIEIEGRKIAGIKKRDRPASNNRPESDHLIVPGFIDVHVHGGGGADTMDATLDAFATIAKTHARSGTTSWLATTVTAPPQQIERVINCAAEYMIREQQRGGEGARLLGVHLEGPYLNPRHRGAQRDEYMIRPDADQFIGWLQRAEGVVRMITIAPEMDGAGEVIREALKCGIVVSAGHTDATWEEMDIAVSMGVTHLTHLFNAMRPLHHREPGLIGYAMGNQSVSADFIVDGVHLHPRMVDIVLSAFGTERLLLITDAMRAACMGDGEFEIGGLHVTVEEGVARIDNGSLAGSLLTLQTAFQRIVQVHGRSVQDASRMASTNPAKLLGLQEAKGRISAGADADLVCLSSSGDVMLTMVEGEIVCDAEGSS